MNNQEIVERLDILIFLMLPKFEPNRYQVKGLGLDILKLADAEHSVEDIMRKLKKPRTAIDQTISKMRGQGLIKSVVKNSKTFYIRIL